MGKLSRNKGKRGERKAVNVLKKLFPNAARDLNDVYKKEGIDLLGTEPFAVQVKHYAKHVNINKLREVKPKDDRIPLLISWPTDGMNDPCVALKLEDFLDILEANNEKE